VVATPKRDHASAPPDLVCRICGHRSARGAFCPVCLAEIGAGAARSIDGPLSGLALSAPP
jgi:hypothetical protein